MQVVLGVEPSEKLEKPKIIYLNVEKKVENQGCSLYLENGW